MILKRYIVKETAKTQIAILFILLIIFFSQKLVRVLADAVAGNIPTNLIFPFLMLGISDMAQLILPLSLFLAILITFGRFYLESEMVAMFACGYSKQILYKVAIILSLITMILTLANSIWFGPWSNKQKDELIENVKINPSLAGLIEGQFQKSPKGDSVLYVGSVSKNHIDNIFIAQLHPPKNQRPYIVLANNGRIMKDKEGNQVIWLDSASRYEGTALLRDFRVSEFNDYQAIIKPKTIIPDEEKRKQNTELLNFWELRHAHTPQAKAEFDWRITLILSVPLMAFLVIPLSEVNPRQGKLANFLPALLLYLMYFLLQSSIKAHGAKGRLDPDIWMWVVNCFYFVIILLLNSWNSVFMRKLRFNSARIQ